MRICQFDDDRLGIVEGSEVIDVSSVLKMPRIGPRIYPFPVWDVLIEELPSLRESLLRDAKTGTRRPLDSVRLHSPVRNPGKLIAAPVNYPKHLEETIADPATFAREHVRQIQETGLFLKATSSLGGAGDVICTRFPDRRTDHEIELVAVIGRKCNEVSRDEALSYVAGYCIGLDITVRGREERSLRKSIDTYSILGPWLVTADEIADPAGLSMKLKVNGELRQRANTSELIMSVPELIEFASKFYTLHPGDVLYTGTPHGVAPIVAGDVVEVSIEKIGNFAIKVTSR